MAEGSRTGWSWADAYLLPTSLDNYCHSDPVRPRAWLVATPKPPNLPLSPQYRLKNRITSHIKIYDCRNRLKDDQQRYKTSLKRKNE